MALPSEIARQRDRREEMTSLIALKGGTELVGDYRIERVLGAGGFGITYLAVEIALNRQVTIKEYFPSDFAARAGGVEAAPRSRGSTDDYRWGLDRFIEEAQALAKFNHPNIVRLYRYFRANNTGYMVLHFEEGQSLKSWLKALGRAPRQKELDSIVAPLLDALDLIHKADFLHRDIAPDNIIIRKDGQPVLIDFGSARREIAAHSKTVSALVKPGYSPYEQYAETSRQQGPWTDIYALGATLYHAVTGRRPPDSPSRIVKDELVPAQEAALAAYRPGFLTAIDHALALSVESRPQSVGAWRGLLLAPEPKQQNWLSRRRANKQPQNREEALGTAATPAARGEHAAEAHPLPPPPDAPGPRGGMVDFLDRLKKKQTPNKAAAAADQPQPAPAPREAAAKIEGRETSSPPPARLPRIFKSRGNGEVKKKEGNDARKPPRPRPVQPRRKTSWRPVLFKLLVGTGVASGAVAMQDRLPHFESRGSGMTSATVKSANQQQAGELKPLVELKGHIGAVTSLYFTDDGRSIVTAGQDGRLKLWNAASGSLGRTIELDNGPATSLALWGTRALTGHAGGEIVLWDFERAEKISTFKRNEAEVWSIVFAGRPDRFAASGHDWKVALWDATNSTGPLQVIDAHESAAQAVAFSQSPQGPLLASGGADKSVKLWNLDTLDRIRTYRGHRDFVSALAFARNASALASASLDGSIRVWSPTSGRLMRRLYGHRGRVNSLAFSPTGDALASGGADGQLRIWDVSRGRTSRTILGPTGSVNAVAFSPDDKRLAAAGDDGIVRLWTNPLHRAATN